jgi:hypothetical protein
MRRHSLTKNRSYDGVNDMGLFHRIFTAEPDELTQVVNEIRNYQKKSEESLVKELQRSKDKQSTTINILRNTK